MMAASVHFSPTFGAERPRQLFRVANGSSLQDVSADGRFLFIKRELVEQSPVTQATVVLNWMQELRRKVPLPE
jgi:hypothetical protein